jgi:NhaA family Na+:H+ antiporter
MSTHTHALPRRAAHQGGRDLMVRLVRFVLNRFLLLPLGAVIGLLWANSEPDSYFRFAHALAFPVNEIAMAFFLALIAQEMYEALMRGGALHAWQHRVLPMFAGVGGVIGAVAVFRLYIGLAHEQVLASAWPVAAAVDLAAGYYVLRLIYPRRNAAVAFLLLLAVVTDVIVMTMVTVRAPEFALHAPGLGLFLVALTSAAALRRQGVKTVWPYWLVSGTLSWLALYWMGIHPALALIPIVPLLPHDPRPGEVFADRPDDDAVHQAEHEWNGVAQVALYLFGLVNAGVILRHFDTGTWAVLVAALVGRPLGILAAVAFGTAMGLRLPRRMSWYDVAVVAIASTSGFTFALFLGTAALPMGAVIDQVKLGALLTAAGAAITVWMAWMFAAGRFKPHAEKSAAR